MPGPDWTYWLIAAAALGASLPALAWSLAWDRARGRERCPSCWYDMGGVPGVCDIRCPECGRVAATRRALARTRRRPLVAALALAVLAAGGGAALTPKVRRDGWLSIVPTEVLVRTMDVSDHRWTAARGEFNRRLLNAGVSDRQWGIVLERAADRFLVTRDRWPVGAPLRGKLWLDSQLGAGSIRAMRSHKGPAATPSGIGFTSIRLARPRDGRPGVPHARDAPVEASDSWQRLEWDSTEDLGCTAPAPGVRVVEVPVEVVAHLIRPTPGNEERVVWRGVIRRAVDFRSGVDACIEPVGGAELAQAIERSLGLRLMELGVPGPPGRPPEPVRAVEVTWPPGGFSTTRLTFAFRIEFVRSGVTISTARILIAADPNPPPGTSSGEFSDGRMIITYATLDGDAAAVFGADPGDPEWVVRLRADPELALRDLDSARAWSGVIEFPLSRVRRGPR
ncbi:MAG: hypothetical protein JNM07_07665 [Phycisphaerae bacterium]|nr:hypothetical protein [Phycisphaerae bacterium]